ncbi:targeting protein for Xklp2-like [Leptidea sinapis]|uniref:targeting protein for Xklp2-like n=1 Tax=Leptidea sinapis TaxID=189913 RepID=UPI0021C2CE5D|nr:targeting protein for Xklp2-like [Leptidea sinapis]
MGDNFVTNFPGEIYFTPNGTLRIKEERLTPEHEDQLITMRKSFSMSDLTSIDDGMNNLNFTDKGDKASPANEFISMAEALFHYQRDTPGRFHSRKPQKFQSFNTLRSGLTVAQSPMLRCKARMRPRYVLSQREREDLEFEELKKIKIKANPVPKSVLCEPHPLPEVPKKPTTVIEPFNLTEIQKKIVRSPEKKNFFKARPAPKNILEKPDVPVRTQSHLLSPLPNQTKKINFNDNVKKVASNKSNHAVKQTVKIDQRSAITVPFSFEKRDEELKRRRDERIKHQIEEERRMASQFKAQPLPPCVKKQLQSSNGSASSSTSDKENHVVKFEAKPPTVLYKAPFKPVRKLTGHTKLAPFELTSDKRAAERQKFEEQLKEKEEEERKQKELKEKEQQEKEQKAIAKSRAQLVHHAKPVPNLNPILPEKIKLPLTVPETPKFVRRLNNK